MQMDFFVMIIAAVIGAIIAALAGVFNKKRLKTLFAWSGIGLIAGFALGYLIAPYIISFL